MADRIIRIANEMRKVISDLVMYELKDPRIPLMTSIVQVKLTKDLKYGKVYVSVFGDESEKAQAIIALKSSSGFIKREIGKRMIIRAIPELTFELDESMEYGAYMSELIDKTVRKNDGGKHD